MAAAKTIITDAGLAKIAAAEVAGVAVKLTTLAVGDGDYIPTGAETKLVSEQYRKPINSASLDPKNKNTILLHTVIDETVGGWYIREYGIFDDENTLIAIGCMDETYKPKPDDVKAVSISLTTMITPSNLDHIEFNLNLDGYAVNEFVLMQDELVKNYINLYFAKLSGADFTGPINVLGIKTHGAGIIASGSGVNGRWYKFANGLILQVGNYQFTNEIPANTVVSRGITFPITFPNGVIADGATLVAPIPSSTWTNFTIGSAPPTGQMNVSFSSGTSSPSGFACQFYAWGN